MALLESYNCQKCGREHTTRFQLTSHIRWHHIKKEGIYENISDYYDEFLKQNPYLENHFK